jgi:uncharacterized membrane protein
MSTSAPNGARLARMESVLAKVLRVGVVVSAAVIAAGVILLVVTRHTGYAPIVPHDLHDLLAYHAGRGPGYFPTTLAAVGRGVVAARPFALIAAGLLLLIATPVVRVALSVVFFAAQRDWRYVAITLFVLAVLAGSFVVGG